MVAAQILLAFVLTVATVVIHGACTAGTLSLVSRVQPEHWMVSSLLRKVATVSLLVILMLVASLLEAWLWSFAYVVSGAIENPEEALYFSVVTFTTLGYGDVTLGPCCRLLGALQAAVGIVVFGWSTALVFAAVQRAISVHASSRE